MNKVERAPVTKRKGRPRRPKRRGEKRSQLSLKVRADVKELVDAEAERVGWTQGATAEILIEKQIAHQETLRAMRLDPDKVRLAQQEEILRRWGWTFDRDTRPNGTILKRWYAPDPTRGPQFGWLPPDENLTPVVVPVEPLGPKS